MEIDKLFDREINELKDKCTWTWCSRNGVEGYNVVGPNGHSIFLPATGYRLDNSLLVDSLWGFYWTFSLNSESPFFAYYLAFLSPSLYDKSIVSCDIGFGHYDRTDGRPVRAVCP